MQDLAPGLIRKLDRSINIVHNPVTGWAILIGSLALTFAAYWFSSTQMHARAEEKFHFRSSEINVAIAERMAIYEQALRSGVALFNASNKVTREEWKIFVDSLQLKERLPGIQGMGYAIPLAPSELTQHQAQIQAQGFPDYHVRPAHKREQYSAIIYLEPFDWRNQRAFGYDMWSNAIRREAMARARDSGTAAISGVITLVQETESNVQQGFLTYLPVYGSAEIPATVAERQQQLSGWVYAAFRASDLMHGIVGLEDTDIAFEIYDGETIKQDSLLFDSNQQLSLDQTAPQPRFSMHDVIQMQGRTWTVVYSAPKKRILNKSEAEQPFYVLIAGIIIDSLLFYVIISLHLVNRHAQRTSAKLRQEHELNEHTLAMQARLVDAKEKESSVFFELAPDAFLVVDEQGKIVKANRYAHELFGYEQGTLPGSDLESLVPAALREKHRVLREQYNKEPRARTLGADQALQATKRSGAEFPATINLVPIEFRGEPHVVAAVHDVSKQKEIENTLAIAKEDAESISRSKSEFVANMSHEIRTPLNAVLGASQLLEKSQLDLNQKKYLKMIRSSGEALLGIINDILDFSKIEAGAMTLAPIEFDLNEILSRVAIMMSVNCGEKDIELVIQVEPSVNSCLVADPLRLQQVLINLVSNAIKFTDSGEVVLSVVCVAHANDGLQTLRFSVRDTGIGMDPLQQQHLFKAFTQADASISRRFGGTGLGLVISNRIVQMMGSRIQLTSEPGVGSEFSFELQLPFAGASVDKNEFLDPRSKRVLVVDDHLQTSISLQQILTSWHWQSDCFSRWQDLEAAISKSSILEEMDFVLIDSHFDSRGADYLLQQLKERGLSKHCVSLVLIGNNQQASWLVEGLQKAFEGVVVKPLISSLLLDALQAATVESGRPPLIARQSRRLQPNTKLKDVKALLVEDNPFNQTIAQGMLADMGVQVSIVSNGAEAVRALREQPDAFDVILMDIQMPVMDGVTATRILRTEMGYKKPIIAMTAGVLKSEHEEYLAVGMDDLVPKPIDNADLFHALGRALPHRKIAALASPSVIVAAPEDALQVFNAERIETLTRGKSKRIVSVIESLQGIFIEAERLLSDAFEHLANNKVQEAQAELHNLKGVVSNYGAEYLADAIQIFEQRLKDSSQIIEPEKIKMSLQSDLNDFVSLAQNWIVMQQTQLRISP